MIYDRIFNLFIGFTFLLFVRGIGAAPADVQQGGDRPHLAEGLPNVETLAKPDLPQKNIHYGHLFIEEINQFKPFNFELSIFGGGELGSPYVNSSFFGLEVKHRINSFLLLGLEYGIHDSNPTPALRALNHKMDLYGFELSYPFLKHQVYINWHWSFFKSHLNMASLFKLNMSFPIQFGIGIMDMEHKNIHVAGKWGGGPKVHLSRRWAFQALLSQTVSLNKAQFLYTWYSLKLIYSL